MSGDFSTGGARWKKMKNADIPAASDLLFNVEDDYVGACGRFIARENLRDSVLLLKEKKREISALIIVSKSTVIPVLCGLNEIPDIYTIKTFLRKKRIHSLQGLKNEALILEDILKQTGKNAADSFDYDLMSLECDQRKMINEQGSAYKTASNLVLLVPKLTDLDALAPLQAAYEKEEVLPGGSVFSPAASRVNLAKIIAHGKILAASLDGRMIGKINVNAVSFTRYQVGGVFVHPDYRGLGIGRLMASVFISSLLGEGRGATLFVKKNNIPARRLYAGLGFTVRNAYRITYY